jgi:CAF1 family ribonuclease
MDVTRENFEELLPSIKEAIGKADFIAIDTELTGECSTGDRLEIAWREEVHVAVTNCKPRCQSTRRETGAE